MWIIWQSLKRSGDEIGGSLLTGSKDITRQEAIKLHTINGARMTMWEDKIGSIEEGKLADIIVLDNDILNCPLDDIKETNVLMTMIGGREVYGD